MEGVSLSETLGTGRVFCVNAAPAGPSFPKPGQAPLHHQGITCSPHCAPNKGLAREHKVGKEEIMGLVAVRCLSSQRFYRPFLLYFTQFLRQTAISQPEHPAP